MFGDQLGKAAKSNKLFTTFALPLNQPLFRRLGRVPAKTRLSSEARPDNITRLAR